MALPLSGPARLSAAQGSALLAAGPGTPFIRLCNERLGCFKIGIPLEAYDYAVNGKPALDWVVERQGFKTDKDSDIVNDTNDWAVETMKNPRYPMELFQRVVTVSVETQKVAKGLAQLEL